MRIMRKASLLLTSALLVVLSGCHVGPKYYPPADEAPIAWKHPTSDPTKAFYADCWWEVFNDYELNKLEYEGLSNSPTLLAALYRVMQARDEAGIAASRLYPQLTLNPSFMSTGLLTMLMGGAGQLGQKITRVHQRSGDLLLNMSYEVDFWGKLDDRYLSALYHEEALEWDYETVMLTLTADIAASYFQIREYDTQLELYREEIASFKKAYEITFARYEGKVSNFSDASRAALLVTNAEAAYFDISRLRDIEEDRLATLIGRPAPEFCIGADPLKSPPPEVPAGVPSDVIFQRPDLLAQEREMASQHALIKAAFADFFPSITLTGALGWSSPDLKHFLHWKSRYWSIGGIIAQTVFDGGAKYFNYELAKDRFGEAGADYWQDTLVAYQEVENALASIELYAKEQAALKESIKWAEKTLQIAKDRYRNGVAIYLEVTTAEQDALEAKRAYNLVLGNRYLSTIQLIKALGGGWRSPDTLTGPVP